MQEIFIIFITSTATTTITFFWHTKSTELILSLVANWNLCSCCETSHILILSAATQINTTKTQILCAKIHA